MLLLLILFAVMIIAACFLLPVIAIPLVIVGVFLYGFAKGFLESLFHRWASK